MNNLIETTLKKIKAENIAPTPRWQFLFKNCIIWGGATLTLVLGSLAVPVILHMLVNNDWELYAYGNLSLPYLILLSLPHFWLTCLALFITLAYYNIRHTKSGYRYGITYIIIGSIVISLMLGGTLYVAGLGRVIDERFARAVPLYDRFARPRHLIWMQPHHGLLAGTVMTVTDETHFRLRDFGDNDWEVTYVMPRPNVITLSKGIRLRVIGERIDEGRFSAHMIAPFDRSRGEWMHSQDLPLPHRWQMMRIK